MILEPGHTHLTLADSVPAIVVFVEVDVVGTAGTSDERQTAAVAS